MSQPAYTRTAILQELREQGPLSAAEIAEALQLPRKTTDAALIGARKTYGTKHFRVVDWRRQIGRGGREIPVYGPGPGSDKPRPELGEQARRETRQRHEQRMREVRRLRERQRRGHPINPWMQLIK